MNPAHGLGLLAARLAVLLAVLLIWHVFARDPQVAFLSENP